MTTKDVLALALEAGLLFDNSHPTPKTRYMTDKEQRLKSFAALVRNAALTEAIDKARIFSLGLPIAQTERLIKALESLKEPTP